MYHSYFATALFIASNVLAQNNPTNQPANGQLNAQQNAGNQANPGPKPQAIPLTCTDSHMPFSERELVEMAQMDAASDPTKPGQPLPDPRSLSNNQTAAICKNEQVTAVCVLDTCDINAHPAPICQTCFEYTPNPNGEDGTVGTVPTQQVVCDDSYNFNKTDTKTPHLCLNKNQKTYSCQTCTGARACDFCYDVKDIPASDAAGTTTTPPNTTTLPVNSPPNAKNGGTAATTTPPTTTPPTTPPTTPSPANS